MEQIEKMSVLLKLVSDPNRLTILAYLKKKELCVCELVEILNISQPAVSQQLRRLKKEEIILERKKGTWVYYRLNPNQDPCISAIISQLPDVGEIHVSACELT